MLGPLIGGFLADVVGLRPVFLFTSVPLFITFLVTYFFVKEEFVPLEVKKMASAKEIIQSLRHPELILSLFLTTFLIQFAAQSISPILSLYVRELSPGTERLALLSGIVASAPGIAALIAAQRLGRLSDKIGAERVLFLSLIHI